jgi:steroid 5-alpha reductase family enzyme
MTIPYLEALAAITASLAILMAGAWVVQQRTGNAGRLDTVWTFSLGLVGACGALRPVEAASCPMIGLSVGDPVQYRFQYSFQYPWGLATLLAPAFIYGILIYVTGIPPLEAQMLRSRGDRYRDYRPRNRQFFPQLPQA